MNKGIRNSRNEVEYRYDEKNDEKFLTDQICVRTHKVSQMTLNQNCESLSAHDDTM